MPLDFRQPNSRGDKKRQRPPQYLSRGVEVRLLAKVMLVGIVVLAVIKARDPAVQQMLGFRKPNIAGGGPLTEQERADRAVNTNLPPKRSAEAGDVVLIPSETATPNVRQESLPEDSAESETDEDNVLRRSCIEGWTQLFTKLSSDEKLLLYKLLKRSRDARSQEAFEADNASDVLTVAAGYWKSYVTEAQLAVDKLPEADRRAWEITVEQLMKVWDEQWQPAMEAISKKAELVAGQRASLVELQSILDEVALAQIEDDTLQRAPEREAWFRMFETLQTTDAETFRKKSIGPIGFLQLFEHPKEYRGKVVTVRGTVEMAYRRPAPKNLCGISGYYIFWLRPAGGPSSPLVIYSLDLPPGFPTISDREQDNNAHTLHEEVEFTGYFFKRWAYSSLDGIRTAPLLLAKAPNWTPAPPPPPPPDWRTWLAIVAGCALAGTAFAAWMHYRVQGAPAGLGPKPVPDVLPKFDVNAVQTPPTEP